MTVVVDDGRTAICARSASVTVPWVRGLLLLLVVQLYLIPWYMYCTAVVPLEGRAGGQAHSEQPSRPANETRLHSTTTEEAVTTLPDANHHDPNGTLVGLQFPLAGPAAAH